MALSVFTHLPKQAFEDWLLKMLSCLKKGGALVFTFNAITSSSDSRVATESLKTNDSDFAYLPFSEDRHFAFVADSIKDDEDYGSSFVTRDYITRFLENNSVNVCFLDRQLVKAQDAVLVIK